MANFTSQPTSNQSPDSGQGGSAVDSPANTGHASTLSGAFDGSTVTKTCRWHTFQAVGGEKKSVTLKITHTSEGGLSGAGAHNLFRLQYTVNGGGAWTTAVERADYTALQSATFSVALSAAQDLTQVQVRDIIQASTGSVGETADSTAIISDIKLEVVTVDAQVVVMM